MSCPPRRRRAVPVARLARPARADGARRAGGVRYYRARAPWLGRLLGGFGPSAKRVAVAPDACRARRFVRHDGVSRVKNKPRHRDLSLAAMSKVTALALFTACSGQHESA